MRVAPARRAGERPVRGERRRGPEAADAEAVARPDRHQTREQPAVVVAALLDDVLHDGLRRPRPHLMHGVLEARAQRRPDGGAEKGRAARRNRAEDSRAVATEHITIARAQVQREIDAIISRHVQLEGGLVLLLGGEQGHAGQPRDLRARGTLPHFTA